MEKKAVKTSVQAGAIGLAIVFVFMICVYSLGGLASVLRSDLHRTCPGDSEYVLT